MKQAKALKVRQERTANIRFDVGMWVVLCVIELGKVNQLRGIRKISTKRGTKVGFGSGHLWFDGECGGCTAKPFRALHITPLSKDLYERALAKNSGDFTQAFDDARHLPPEVVDGLYTRLGS